MAAIFLAEVENDRNLLYDKRLRNQHQICLAGFLIVNYLRVDRAIAETYRGRSRDRVKYLQQADRNSYRPTAERCRVRRARRSASGELEARAIAT